MTAAGHRRSWAYPRHVASVELSASSVPPCTKQAIHGWPTVSGVIVPDGGGVATASGPVDFALLFHWLLVNVSVHAAQPKYQVIHRSVSCERGCAADYWAARCCGTGTHVQPARPVHWEDSHSTHLARAARIFDRSDRFGDGFMSPPQIPNAFGRSADTHPAR